MCFFVANFGKNANPLTYIGCMKKIKIVSFNLRCFATNFVIVLMLVSVSLCAFCGVQFVKTTSANQRVFFCGDQTSNKVTLMVNVYWGTEYIEPMLEIFEKYDITTTFFVGGVWAVKESEMLKKIYQAGHEIANHGYNHKEHKKLSMQNNLQEIENTHNVVKSILGIDMSLFAPPSGSYNQTTIDAVESLGYKTIMWTEGRDTIDWRDKDSEVIYRRAIKNCKGGDFVLMHPTEATKNALEKIIVKLKQDGFELCSISQNLQQN